jgi:hypothetical protein
VEDEVSPPTPADASAARELLLADGECAPGLPLPGMVERVLQQRDRARAALRRYRGGAPGPDCADMTCEDE